MFFVLSSSGIYRSNISFSASIIKLSTLKRFKVFKKTTKFKKYALGLSKTIINRKKYITRKRRSSFLIFQKYAYFWSFIYSQMRCISNFLCYFFSFKHTIFLLNLKFLKNKLPLLSATEDMSFLSTRFVKKVFYNVSLVCRGSYFFKFNCKYVDNSFLISNKIFSKKVFTNLMFTNLFLEGNLFGSFFLLFSKTYKVISHKSHFLFFENGFLFTYVLQILLLWRRLIILLVFLKNFKLLL